MDKSKLSADERLYLEAKRYCRRIKAEERGDLYYALLDWCDKHQDVLESLARAEDTYDVVYIDHAGESHQETFTEFSGGNPYRLARTRYGEILNSHPLALELRHRPNPYISGPARMGGLILSYEERGSSDA